MKKFLLLLLIIFLPHFANGETYPNALDIIKKEGQFVFTDGSSYYRFSSDGSFDSGPLSFSGRTINGKWKIDGVYKFTIEGQWGWMNGMSSINDNRRLILTVQPDFILQPAPDKQTKNIILDSKAYPKIYRCYFAVEELVKLRSQIELCQ